VKNADPEMADTDLATAICSIQEKCDPPADKLQDHSYIWRKKFAVLC
jgi:hypothetical protein